jgi:hypothetical protein
MSGIRSLALLSVVVALSACYSWGPPRPIAQSALEAHPDRLRATLSDGRQIVLRDPRVQGDSLLGDTLVSQYESANAQWARAAIPLGHVGTVSTRSYSTGGATLAVVGIIAGTVAVVTLVTNACPGC